MHELESNCLIHKLSLWPIVLSRSYRPEGQDHRKLKNITVAPAVIVGRARAKRASSHALVCGFTLPSCRGFGVLSKVFVFAIIVSSVLITGVVAAVGTYPRLVLRDSQPITDRRPISNRGTSETA